ncbi:hypothetical protein KAE70_00500 [Bartonella henselae]|uniref:Uncharacterized protein n=1 Tax=Bartonella henselae TaxID=38323 RepID=X5M786_BARHN|nr:hypothetical protein [Bartonella henselae]UJM33055.1 hypothetical protein KAE70_00500 [Bartonella henselae]UJM43384.1 hypothetical protein KAE73_00870 [Bartonella henselae]CDO46798.1 hypothetical protein BM1374165_00786 [Bartonella henselae]
MREKNDCTSRVIPSHESIDQLAIEMRVKRFGLTIEEAKNPLSGTYIGRLCLFGYRQDALSISQGQYDAAQKYLEVRNDYSCAKGLPSAVYDEMPSSSDDKAREKWVERATEQFCNMQKVLKEAQCLYRQHNLYAALQYLVMEDQELPHLVNALRIALNTLQKYFDPKSKW